MAKAPPDPLAPLLAGRSLAAALRTDADWDAMLIHLNGRLTGRLDALDRRVFKSLLVLRAELVWEQAWEHSDRVTALQALRLLGTLTGTLDQ